AMKAGFLAACAASPQGKIKTTILEHEEDVGVFTRSLLRLMARHEPPTAIILTNSYFCGTALSVLLGHGFDVPKDVSIICRDDDLFLKYLVPSPARYETPPEEFAS